jgi:hypothetical protein
MTGSKVTNRRAGYGPARKAMTVFQRLWKLFAPGAAKPRPPCRPSLESLEARLAPAADCTWVGGTSSDWDTATNWVGSNKPDSTKTVDIINGAGAAHQPLVGATQTDACKSFNLGGTNTLYIAGTLTTSGGDNTISGTVDASLGTPKLNINGGTTTMSGSGSFVDTVTTTVYGGATFVVDTHATGTVQLDTKINVGPDPSGGSSTGTFKATHAATFSHGGLNVLAGGTGYLEGGSVTYTFGFAGSLYVKNNGCLYVGCQTVDSTTSTVSVTSGGYVYTEDGTAPTFHCAMSFNASSFILGQTASNYQTIAVDGDLTLVSSTLSVDVNGADATQCDSITEGGKFSEDTASTLSVHTTGTLLAGAHTYKLITLTGTGSWSFAGAGNTFVNLNWNGGQAWTQGPIAPNTTTDWGLTGTI